MAGIKRDRKITSFHSYCSRRCMSNFHEVVPSYEINACEDFILLSKAMLKPWQKPKDYPASCQMLWDKYTAII